MRFLEIKLKHKSLHFGILILTCSNSFQAQTLSNIKVPTFKLETSYVGDIVTNFNGGIKTGSTYLGLLNIKAGITTENTTWWKGGNFFINVGNTHGGKPSTTLVGDFQGVSNIEAGNLTFLYELWFKQKIGNFNLYFGLQDLNANFSTSVNGAVFTNSSFGIQSSIADNIPTPIFPLTALGGILQWKISNSFLCQTALFDGTPDDFETNPYNIHWKLSRQQGFLSVTEFQIKKSLLSGKNACYKFGIYYHQHNDTIDNEQKNGGLYFVGDQQLSDKISFFSQIGLSPKSLNKHNHYYSIGMNYTGISLGRPNDQLGLAVAYAGFDGNNIGSETAIELTYKFQINKNIYVRPDLQYIINPVGTNKKLENALVGSVRFGLVI